MFKSLDNQFIQANRSQTHPETNEGVNDQIADDGEWFRSHPNEICRFRPAKEVDEAIAIDNGSYLCFLCNPDRVPEEEQTWIALIDIFRVRGMYMESSGRLKFRCPPVNLKNELEVQVASKIARECTLWALEQVRLGNAQSLNIVGKYIPDAAGKGFGS